MDLRTIKKPPNKQITLPNHKIGLIIESKKYGPKIVIIDPADVSLVGNIRWNVQPSNHTFYAQRKRIGEKGLILHRVFLGVTNPKIEVDHRDGNGLHNSRFNLRKATRSQNQQNRGKNSNNKTSGLKGVYPNGYNWQAIICINRIRIYLGTFPSKKEAHATYAAASKKYHGNFGRAI